MNQAKNHDPLSQQCYAFRLTEISERPFCFFSETDHPETMYTSILGDSLWGQHSGSERGRLLTLLIWRSGYKNSAEAWPRLHAATVYGAHAVYLWFESIWSLWKLLKINTGSSGSTKHYILILQSSVQRITTTEIQRLCVQNRFQRSSASNSLLPFGAQSIRHSHLLLACLAALREACKSTQPEKESQGRVRVAGAQFCSSPHWYLQILDCSQKSPNVT